MNRSLVVWPEGRIGEYVLPTEPEKVLDAIYMILGCTTVDVVSLTDELDMWLDDEGIYRQGVNMLASKLAHRYGRIAQAHYYGTVLICSRTDDGETLNLTPDQIAVVLDQLTRRN